MHLCFALVCCRPGTACQLPQYKIMSEKEKTVAAKNNGSNKLRVTLRNCFSLGLACPGIRASPQNALQSVFPCYHV